MKKISVIHCLVLILLPIQVSFSQNLVRISNEEGLECSYVTSICKDVGEMLWIGTMDGVKIMCNQEIKSVDLGNGPILENETIDEIAKTDDGFMWLQTGKGLFKLDLYTGQQTVYEQFSGSYIIRRSLSKKEIAVLDRNQNLFIYNKTLDEFVNVNIPLQAESQILNFGFTEDYLWTSGNSGLIRYKCVSDGEGTKGLGDFDKILDDTIVFCNKSQDKLYAVNGSFKLFQIDLDSADVTEMIDLREDIIKRGVPTGIAQIADGFFGLTAKSPWKIC